jgi:hypothetical protein
MLTRGKVFEWLRLSDTFCLNQATSLPTLTSELSEIEDHPIEAKRSGQEYIRCSSHEYMQSILNTMYVTESERLFSEMFSVELRFQALSRQLPPL